MDETRLSCARAGSPVMSSAWLAFWLAGALLIWWLPWTDRSGSASPKALLSVLRAGALELFPTSSSASVVSLLLLLLTVSGVIFVNRAAVPQNSRGMSVHVRTGVMLLALLSGGIWTLGHIQHARRQNLNLDHSIDVSVVGRVVGLPQWHRHALRFVLRVESVDDGDRHWHLPGNRLMLRRYGYPAGLSDWIEGGRRYRMQVRLRPDQSSRNPGAFDYRRWLFRQQVVATGYVRGHVERVSGGWPERWSGWLDRLRSDLRARLAHEVHDPVGRGLVLGLGLGDRSSLPRADWALLLATGTNHLLAISGLHVGMVAGLFALLVGGIWRRTRYCEGIPAQRVAAMAALLAAWVYALLAGLSIPTERAAIMLTVLLSGVLLARRWRALDLWLLAAVLVLLLDPFAPLDAGFWLSFLAVLVIILWVVRRPHQPLWRRLIELQLILTLALWPLVWGFFDRIAWASLPANLVAVPLVSWVITPLALLSLGVGMVIPTALGALTWLIALLGHVLFGYLDWLNLHLPQSHWPAPPFFLLLFAAAGVVLLFQPGRWPGRGLGILLILPVLLYCPIRPPEGQVVFWVFDLHRGAACLIRTHSHVLVYGRGAVDTKRLQTALTNLGVTHPDAVRVDSATAHQRVTWRALRPEPQQSNPFDPIAQHWCWDGVCFDQSVEQGGLEVTDGSGCVTLIRTATNGSWGKGAAIELGSDRSMIRMDTGTRIHAGNHDAEVFDTRLCGALKLAAGRVDVLADHDWPFAWRVANAAAVGDCSRVVSTDASGMKKPRS